MVYEVEIECIAFIPSAIFFFSYLCLTFSVLCFLPDNFQPQRVDLIGHGKLKRKVVKQFTFLYTEGKNLDGDADCKVSV